MGAHGQGKAFYPNGAVKFEGEWRDGKPFKAAVVSPADILPPPPAVVSLADGLLPQPAAVKPVRDVHFENEQLSAKVAQFESELKLIASRYEKAQFANRMLLVRRNKARNSQILSKLADDFLLSAAEAINTEAYGY